MLAVKVGDAPAALRAASVAMKGADKTIRSDISQRMRSTMNPVWRGKVAEKAGRGGGMAARMLTTGTRIAAGNPPVLIAASGNRKVGRGLTPNRNAAGYEFGASDGTSVQSSGRGSKKRYSRHSMRHLPPRHRKGRAVYPGAAETLPRVASYWAQSVVKAFMDAAEGKEG